MTARNSTTWMASAGHFFTHRPQPMQLTSHTVRAPVLVAGRSPCPGVGAQHRYAVLCPPQVDEPPGTLPAQAPQPMHFSSSTSGAAQIIDLHSAEPAGLHAGPAGHAAIGAEQAAVFIPLGPAAAAAMDRRRPGREFPLDCHGFSPSFLLISPISIPQITPLAKREPAIPAPTLPPTKKICAGGLTGEGKLYIISIRLENKLLLRR